MGDHRISLKIEFSMHGHENKWDTCLNWSDNLPDRARDWIEKQHSIAMSNFWEEEGQLDAMKKAEKEKQERELLASLKAKYET